VSPISCTYTSTNDEHFILDASGPIVVGAGFSGHGFKFVPTVGRVLADLVEDLGRPSEKFSLQSVRLARM
jgi:sarcosine oxidase